MKKFFIIVLSVLIILFIAGCSDDTTTGTVSVSLTDSTESLIKDGMIFTMQLGIDQVALGYMEGADTIWVNLLDVPDTMELNLKMQEIMSIEGCDSIEIEGDTPYDFLKLTITPPIVKADSIEIPCDYDMDTMNILFTFGESVSVENNHVNFTIDFHSDKWMDPFSIPSMINPDSLQSAMTCEINK